MLYNATFNHGVGLLSLSFQWQSHETTRKNGILEEQVLVFRAQVAGGENDSGPVTSFYLSVRPWSMSLIFLVRGTGEMKVRAEASPSAVLPDCTLSPHLPNSESQDETRLPNPGPVKPWSSCSLGMKGETD